MKTLETLGSDFVRRHDWLLATARNCEIAVCGGVAAAVSKDRRDYVATDIDLVSTKANALRFIDAINHFLIEKNVHYRIYVNSHNNFVPKPASAHFRIQCPFWLPVCLFVLPHDGFRYYRINGGHLLQLPQDVKQAADALTEIDAKPRLANEEAEEFELVNLEAPPEDKEGEEIPVWIMEQHLDHFDSPQDTTRYPQPP